MNVTLNKVLWFVVGAGIGVAATRSYFKTKYERIAQEEIDSVKRAFSAPHQAEPVADDTEAESACVVSDIIHENGYNTADDIIEPIRKEVTGVSRPYVISPADFDTLDDYECYSLDYFEDGVLADNMGNVIEDIDAVVGRDSLNHFGEFEDDAVHVRNDAQQCDYEILKDLRKYSDVYTSGRRPTDD